MIGGRRDADGGATDLPLAMNADRRVGGVEDVDQHEGRLERAVCAAQHDIDRIVTRGVQCHDLRRGLTRKRIVEPARHEDDAALEELLLQPARCGRHHTGQYIEARQRGNAPARPDSRCTRVRECRNRLPITTAKRTRKAISVGHVACCQRTATDTALLYRARKTPYLPPKKGTEMIRSILALANVLTSRG